MSGFVINQKTGLGSFPELEDKFGVRNYVTYSNNVWGNMNPFFADSREVRDEIAKKDKQIADLLKTKFVGVMTTPPEGTIIQLSERMRWYLNYTAKPDDQGYKFVPLEANAVVLTAREAEVVFAPRDCAVMLFVHKNWPGVLCLHLGAPQVIQGLHEHALLFFRGLFPDINVSEFSVFITPYLCSEHYCLNEERADKYVSCIPGIDSYFKSVKSDTERNISFNFMGFVQDDLRKKWGICKYVESGMCTYEEASKGNLFSYTLSKEDEVKYPHGAFNVAIGLGDGPGRAC
ncbi:laccase domain-containing protein [Patescibacteria group bacterium]|nr:laccase domain-containing protein [Patescibacteria group bacterium]MBU1868095.1 laccase domain-containing protein [Patescibacteria group bacterium]